MALAVFVQFFTRYVLNNCFAWTEEIATNCLVVVVFIGSVMCVRLVAAHPGRFPLPLPPRPARPARSRPLVDVVRIVFFAYAACLVWRI